MIQQQFVQPQFTQQQQVFTTNQSQFGPVALTQQQQVQINEQISQASQFQQNWINQQQPQQLTQAQPQQAIKPDQETEPVNTQ